MYRAINIVLSVFLKFIYIIYYAYIYNLLYYHCSHNIGNLNRMHIYFSETVFGVL